MSSATSPSLDSFEFDCPSKYYYDISAEKENSKCSIGDTAWFFRQHPLHEPQDMSIAEDLDLNSKKRPSLLKTGAAVARIFPNGRKSEGTDSAVQRAKTCLNPPVKTAVVPTTFVKPISGSKRPLSQSVDSTSSASDTTHRDIRTATNNASKNLSYSSPKLTTAAKLKQGSNNSMSSKLEEYRQSKKPVAIKPMAASGAVKRPNSSKAATKALISEKHSASTDDQDMLDILKRHNEKFAAAPLYEPSRHSVRDVRKWEKINGKSWSSLSPEEREAANKDIACMKTAQQ